MEHMPKSTQRVAGCFLKLSKSTWYLLIRKTIRFQKIFSEGQKVEGVGDFRENFDKYQGNFSSFHSWKGSSGKILKSIMVLFLILLAEEVRIFQKFLAKFRKVL